MRRAWMACIIVVLLPAASAQADTVLHMKAFSTGNQYWFEVEGTDGKNPALHLAPGQRVEVTLQNEASLGHNIRFGSPVDKALPILQPGEQDTFTFTVPADATGATAYWCEPHQDLGMEGQVRWEAGEEGAPAVTAPLLAVLVLLVARRWR